MTSDARVFAYANIELEGVKLTPEFKVIYEAFADNKISQLEAFRRLGINIEQIPSEKRDELAKMFMNDLQYIN
ncbi:hypothetical protein [Aliamphritea ceti]|uniref:hypothetical protein n=1 Tax=Aliamphritea ceti TaxID=1524258 RepID=UPI0021C37305|nr:hypothetical protein [Aliamphritea ceti]